MEWDENSSYFDFLTCGVAVTLFAIIGLIGNVVSLIVLSRPEMRSSINCVLQGLAVYDSLLLISSLFIFGLSSLSWKVRSLDYYLDHLYPQISLVMYPLAYMAHIGSTWSTVGVSIERYIAVCHPLKARSLCTYGRARLCNITVFIFSVCYNLPRCWEYNLIEKFDTTKNHTIMTTVQSDLRLNDIYFKVYYTSFYILVRFLIPFLILSVLNGLIIRTVRSINKDRRNLGENVQKEISLAVMLICVVAVFFLCNVFALIVKLVEYGGENNIYLMDFSNTLIVFNSSVNFIIYCIFAKKFRQVLTKVFCRHPVRNVLQKFNIWAVQVNCKESSTNTSLASVTTDAGPGQHRDVNPSIVANTRL